MEALIAEVDCIPKTWHVDPMKSQVPSSKPPFRGTANSFSDEPAAELVPAARVMIADASDSVVNDTIYDIKLKRRYGGGCCTTV
jgi:hypothetical protein